MTSYNALIEKSKSWLTNDVYPLWSTTGIDKSKGGFIENISFDGSPMDVPRRSMVQARQMYSFVTGANLGVCDKPLAHSLVEMGGRYLMANYSASSGAFIHSINLDGSPKSSNPDLYTEAFALFALAQAYIVNPRPEIKERAKALVKYLHRERAVSGGGFTEMDEKGTLSYKSNPHMHMFESAIAWMQIDKDAEWKELGQNIISLCLNKFIDPESGVLGEYFDKDWNHLREKDLFIYEPGHQYEWAWLMSLYEGLTGQDLQSVRHNLFLLAEKHGTSRTRKVVFDEMWSNYTPKTLSSRFWPQCERIKAACRLGTEVAADKKDIYAHAADEAMETLFKFFQTPLRGTWYDMLSDKDEFSGTFAKASSLYHIVNAMEEYINLRPRL
ncbi:MAG: mannose-6-phosphate isomerase [Bdellovibrio sp. ArHS]|uniref:AGE family epimerase/isomerase n=1 Tax=Bdellovibrio sp. ArHS TaxID=1569284 RepID=UPI00058240FB|nr:AGE family epimerase/isomerase [Bdellovibrio sp. ArHS]KHD89883.1 MAG: mannose-6-phosphate isomerase [Bdellovibrio sp. ArHS]